MQYTHLDILVADSVARVSMNASHYLLSGRLIATERAREPGLVGDDVHSSCRDMPGATRLGPRLPKNALSHSIDMPGLDAVIALEDRDPVLALRGEDFDEGVRAFIEKPSPSHEGTRAP